MKNRISCHYRQSHCVWVQTSKKQRSFFHFNNGGNLRRTSKSNTSTTTTHTPTIRINHSKSQTWTQAPHSHSLSPRLFHLRFPLPLQIRRNPPRSASLSRNRFPLVPNRIQQQPPLAFIPLPFPSNLRKFQQFQRGNPRVFDFWRTDQVDLQHNLTMQYFIGKACEFWSNLVLDRGRWFWRWWWECWRGFGGCVGWWEGV